MTKPMIPLKRVAMLNPEVLAESTDAETGITYVDIGSVGRGKLVERPQVLPFGKAPSRARRIVRDQDIILSTVRTYLRAVLPIDETLDGAIASTGFVVVRPHSVHPGFLSWALQGDTFVEEVVSRSVGVSYPAISPTVVGSLKIWVPADHLQRLIAEFLHRETSRVDQLVASRQKLVQLVDAELASANAAAIAPGSGSAASPRSPAEWFTDLPDDWGVAPLRRVARYANSSVDKKINHGEQQVRVCNYTDVYYGSYIDSSDEFRTASATATEINRYVLKKGDVLMTKDSETASDIGVPALVAADLDAVSGYHLTHIRPQESISAEYLYWVLMSPQLRGYFETVANGVTRFGLTLRAIGDAPIPLPRIEEQQAIARSLRNLQLRAIRTAEQAERQIARLDEYRQALITAAVTGQIDEAVLRGDIAIEEALQLEMTA